MSEKIKIAKPECLGKYPEKPIKKCRTCGFHVDCKVRSKGKNK